MEQALRIFQKIIDQNTKKMEQCNKALNFYRVAGADDEKQVKNIQEARKTLRTTILNLAKEVKASRIALENLKNSKNNDDQPKQPPEDDEKE